MTSLLYLLFIFPEYYISAFNCIDLPEYCDFLCIDYIHFTKLIITYFIFNDYKWHLSLHFVFHIFLLVYGNATNFVCVLILYL